MIDETNPVNLSVTTWLKAHGNPNPPHGSDWAIVDGYELHSHPDLCEYLDALTSPNQNVTKAFYHGYRVHCYEGIIFAFAPGMAGIAMRHPLGEVRSIMKLARRLGLDWILIKVLRKELRKPMYDVAYRYTCGDMIPYVPSSRLEEADIEEAREQMRELIGSWFSIKASLWL